MGQKGRRAKLRRPVSRPHVLATRDLRANPLGTGKLEGFGRLLLASQRVSAQDGMRDDEPEAVLLQFSIIGASDLSSTKTCSGILGGYVP